MDINIKTQFDVGDVVKCSSSNQIGEVIKVKFEWEKSLPEITYVVNGFKHTLYETCLKLVVKRADRKDIPPITERERI